MVAPKNGRAPGKAVEMWKTNNRFPPFPPHDDDGCCSSRQEPKEGTFLTRLDKLAGSCLRGARRCMLAKEASQEGWGQKSELEILG